MMRKMKMTIGTTRMTKKKKMKKTRQTSEFPA
jgi:hypothetical protein